MKAQNWQSLEIAFNKSMGYRQRTFAAPLDGSPSPHMTSM